MMWKRKMCQRGQVVKSDISRVGERSHMLFEKPKQAR